MLDALLLWVGGWLLPLAPVAFIALLVHLEERTNQ